MSQPPRLVFKKLDVRAKAPCRQHLSDAGYDVFVCFPTLSETLSLQTDRARVSVDYDAVHNNIRLTVQPGGLVLVPTGIAVRCPPDVCWQIWPRSGLAIKQGLDRKAGLVDSGYRGHLVIVLQNHSTEPVVIVQNMKIAQLVPVRIDFSDELELAEVDDLEESDRKASGFGSTGLF
jgi:dUTP pyrophosphatase